MAQREEEICREDDGSSDHQTDAESRLDRAIKLRESGDLEGSLQLLNIHVSRCMHQGGRNSYDTQCALSQLGRTLRAMRRLSEALDLHWEVLAIRCEKYGRDDQFTQNSAQILNDALFLLNDHQMAAAVNLWRCPPDDPSLFDLAAMAEIEIRLKTALAARQAQVANHAAQLVHNYLKRPIQVRILCAGLRARPGLSSTLL